MNGTTIASIALLGVTVLLFGLVQFVPMSQEQDSGSAFGFSYDFRYGTTLWGAYFSGNGESDRESWFSNDADDADGVGLIRAAIPMILAGALAALIGLVLLATGMRMAGGVLAASATSLLTVGFILFVVGHGQVWSDSDGSAPAWAVGFYFAIAGLVTSLVATILAFVPTTGTPAPRTQQADFN